MHCAITVTCAVDSVHGVVPSVASFPLYLQTLLVVPRNRSSAGIVVTPPPLLSPREIGDLLPSSFNVQLNNRRCDVCGSFRKSFERGGVCAWYLMSLNIEVPFHG